VLCALAGGTAIALLGGRSLRRLRAGPRTELDQRDDRVESNVRSFLEKTFAQNGVAGVQSYLQTAPETQVRVFIDWATATAKVGLYPIVAGFAGDTRPRVRTAAVVCLGRVAPTDLVASKPTLQAALQLPGYDPVLGARLSQIIAAIP